MILENLQMLYLMATMLIVYELSLTSPSVAMAVATAVSSSSSSLKETKMAVNSFSHINRLPRQTVQGLRQNMEDSSAPLNPTKRSYSTDGSNVDDGGWASMLNSLPGLMSSHHQQSHIRSNAQSTGTITHQQQYTEAKPIYEQQQENDYAGGSGSESSSSSSSAYNQHSEYGGNVANLAALQSAIHNLQTAGTHNAAVGTSASTNNGGSNGFLPSWNFGKLSTSFIGSHAASTPYNSGSDSRSNNDKISEGNFLHHYDSASAYNEYTPQHEYEHEQQQQQYQQQYEKFYNSNEQTDAETSASYDNAESEHDNSNYLPSIPPTSSVGHFQQHYSEQEHQQQEKQPDVINYVPYPVVKKQHVPTYEPVHIPVSHAVIIPVSKPVPIHIPVTQNVQVPVEKELKIPVERVIPYPVEKHIPVPVEKRVPYHVFKYVPIKVPRPFPVKVPVFKTVLHKVKGWW